MSKALLYVFAVVLAPVVVCGCTHPGVHLSDLLGSMSQVPHSSSSPYVPVDASLSMVKETGEEDTLLRLDGLGTKGGIPPEFKGKVLNLSDCIRVTLEVSPETHSTW